MTNWFCTPVQPNYWKHPTPMNDSFTSRASLFFSCFVGRAVALKFIKTETKIVSCGDLVIFFKRFYNTIFYLKLWHSYPLGLPLTPVYPRAWRAIYGVTTVWAAKQSRSCGCFLFPGISLKKGYEIWDYIKMLFKLLNKRIAVNVTSSMSKINLKAFSLFLCSQHYWLMSMPCFLTTQDYLATTPWAVLAVKAAL